MAIGEEARQPPTMKSGKCFAGMFRLEKTIGTEIYHIQTRSGKKMVQITYASMVCVITAIWCLLRVAVAVKNKGFCWKRELQLILVYICIVVVARFTFFPFSKVNGEIQPLVFDGAKAFPFRINWIPFVNLFDYPAIRDILINVIGNTAMFIPLGIVWPSVYRALDSHKKVILAGVGVSVCIEILQLPFYDRVTDIDDLLLNSIGFIVGYLLYLLVRRLGKRGKNDRSREQLG